MKSLKMLLFGFICLAATAQADLINCKLENSLNLQFFITAEKLYVTQSDSSEQTITLLIEKFKYRLSDKKLDLSGFSGRSGKFTLKLKKVDGNYYMGTFKSSMFLEYQTTNSPEKITCTVEPSDEGPATSGSSGTRGLL